MNSRSVETKAASRVGVGVAGGECRSDGGPIVGNPQALGEDEIEKEAWFGRNVLLESRGQPLEMQVSRESEVSKMSTLDVGL